MWPRSVGNATVNEATQWKTVLQRIRTHSLQLDAVMRGCKPAIFGTNYLAMLCPYAFHRGKLKEGAGLLQRIFGTVEVFDSKEEYIKTVMEDSLVQLAVDELKARILVGGK